MIHNPYYCKLSIHQLPPLLHLPVEGGVESVKVAVLFFRGFFLGSSLSSWSWSLVASPELIIKNANRDHSTGLEVLQSIYCDKWKHALECNVIAKSISTKYKSSNLFDVVVTVALCLAVFQGWDLRKKTMGHITQQRCLHKHLPVTLGSHIICSLVKECQTLPGLREHFRYF